MTDDNNDNTENEAMTDAPNTDVDEEELNPDEIEETLTNFHDMLDQIKNAGRSLGETLQEEAQDAQEEGDMEEAQNYMRLANAAQTAFQRVENGDSNVRRGGL